MKMKILFGVVVMFFFTISSINAQLDINDIDVKTVDGMIEISFESLPELTNYPTSPDNLKIDIINYVGKANVKLMEYQTFYDYSYEDYECNCKPTINGTQCDLCQYVTEYPYQELVEINPDTYILNRHSKIYEVFNGCDQFGKTDDGYGCLAWTDVTILNQQIEGATWWNESWGSCRNITINGSMIYGNLTDYPALISLDNSTGNFATALDDWNDVIFINNSCALNGSMMDFEKENYTIYNATYWVRLPEITPAGLEIAVYYDTPFDPGDLTNATGVWDEHYIMVLHLPELNTSTRRDSTQYNNDGTPANFDNNEPIWALADGGDFFELAREEYLRVSDHSNLRIFQNMTLELWLRGDNQNSWTRLMGKDAIGSPDYSVRYTDVQTLQYFLYDGVSYDVTTTSTVNDNEWHYIVGTKVNAVGNIYLDAMNQDTNNAFPTSGVGFTSTDDLTVAVGESDAGDPIQREYNGSIDEIRISNISRSYEWINTTYFNLINPLLFYTLSGEQDVPVVPVPNVTELNVSNIWDVGRDLPVYNKFCEDNVTLLIIRQRVLREGNAYTNRTQYDREICYFGCHNDSFNGPECGLSDWNIRIWGFIMIILILIILFLVTFFKLNIKQRRKF
jgi:hypothetical protein